MGKSKIEWTEATWNPIRGCSLVSEGCRNCYAMKMAHRFSGPGQPYEGLTELGPDGPRWNGKVRLVPELLDEPLHWKRPRRVFVNSMGDLFHEALNRQAIYQVFMAMWAAHWHTFQVLTKRAERMRELVSAWLDVDRMLMQTLAPDALPGGGGIPRGHEPLANVWFGVSCEDQQAAKHRIPFLLRTPAAVRFISYEPALGPLDIEEWLRDGIPTDAQLDLKQTPSNLACRYVRHGAPRLDWVIAGGESGPGARPAHPDSFRDVAQQCAQAGVPFFMKQIIEDGRRLPFDLWPDDLKIRQFPQVSAHV